MLTKTLLDFFKTDWDQVQYPWCNSIGWLRLWVKKKNLLSISTIEYNFFFLKVEKKLKNKSGEKLMWEEVW